MGAEHRGGPVHGVALAHAPRPINKGQFVGVDIQRRHGGVGLRIGGGRAKQLALRTHRDILSCPHRQGAGQQSGQAGDEHGVVGHAAGTDTQHQGEVADQSVVRPEHRGAKAAGQPAAALGGQRPDHLAVDAFVGGHGGGGVSVGVIGRPCLGTLSQCQHEHRSEVAGQKTQQPGTDIAAPRLADILVEQGQPELLVTALGGGQRQQDVALLAGAALRQIAVNGRFGALVGKMLSPAPKVGCGRLSPIGISLASVLPHPTMIATETAKRTAELPWRSTLQWV